MKEFDIIGACLFDGGLGTELYNRGTFINRCFESENLTNPGLVEQIHRDYLTAGAEVITTNSWGANRYKLKHFNLLENVADINRRAAEIAKDIAGETAFVAAAVGPLGVRLEPWGPTSFAEAFEAFSEQISALVAGGADIICLEILNDNHL